MQRIAPIFVILAASLWGIDGIVLRPSLYSLPVAVVVLIESSIVALLLSPFFVKPLLRLENLSHRDFLAFLGVAVLGGAIGTMSITRALFYVNFVNLSIVILIQKLQPVFAILLASLLLKERPPREFFLWAVLALAGAYLMTFGWHLPNMQTGDKITEAAFYALIAAMGFGASTVLSKRALRNVGFGLGTYLRFLLSALVMAVLVLLLGEYSHIRDVSPSQTVIFLMIAFITGGPAIFLYYFGLKRISASVATICELAFPLTAVLLEYFLHNNLLSLEQWGGALVLFGSIIKVTRIESPAVDPSGA